MSKGLSSSLYKELLQFNKTQAIQQRSGHEVFHRRGNKHKESINIWKIFNLLRNKGYSKRNKCKSMIFILEVEKTKSSILFWKGGVKGTLILSDKGTNRLSHSLALSSHAGYNIDLTILLLDILRELFYTCAFQNMCVIIHNRIGLNSKI